METKHAIQGVPDQMLSVLLGDVTVPPWLKDRLPLPRVRRLSGSRFDQNDVDDLIVFIDWLVRSRLEDPQGP